MLSSNRRKKVWKRHFLFLSQRENKLDGKKVWIVIYRRLPHTFVSIQSISGTLSPCSIQAWILILSSFKHSLRCPFKYGLTIQVLSPSKPSHICYFQFTERHKLVFVLHNSHRLVASVYHMWKLFLFPAYIRFLLQTPFWLTIFIDDTPFLILNWNYE